MLPSTLLSQHPMMSAHCARRTCCKPKNHRKVVKVVTIDNVYDIKLRTLWPLQFSMHILQKADEDLKKATQKFHEKNHRACTSKIHSHKKPYDMSYVGSPDFFQ